MTHGDCPASREVYCNRKGKEYIRPKRRARRAARPLTVSETGEGCFVTEGTDSAR